MIYNSATPHRDFFGTQVDVGDLVLGAKGRRHNFEDTTYNIAVVIGKTKGMLRLHQLGDTRVHMNQPKDKILESLRYREGKRGGAVLATNLINLNKPTGITEQEFKDALEKGKHQPILSPAKIFGLAFP